MNTTARYRASRDRRREFWYYIALTPLIALGSGLLLSFRQFTLPHLAFAAGLTFAMIVPFTLWLGGRYLGSTTTDSQGLRPRGSTVRGSVPWRDVTAVEILDLNARGNHTYVVQLRRAQGRPLKLPGLIGSMPDDPDLLGALEEIRATWTTWTNATNTTNTHPAQP